MTYTVGTVVAINHLRELRGRAIAIADASKWCAKMETMGFDACANSLEIARNASAIVQVVEPYLQGVEDMQR